MRLSKPSMDKLYDLMTMGLKYQLIQCRDPCEILQLTLNHLDVIFKMVEDGDVLDVVREVIGRVKMLASSMTLSDWKLIQEQLYAFFQDKHIKVSLFLNSGIQYQNGHYKIERMEERVLPFRGKCGEVTLYDEEGNAQQGEQKGPFPHPYVSLTNPDEDNIEFVNHLNAEKRTCKFGYNMYLSGNSSTQQEREKQGGGKSENQSGTSAPTKEQNASTAIGDSAAAPESSTDLSSSKPTSILDRLQQQSGSDGVTSPVSDRFRQYEENNNPSTQTKSSHEFNLLAHILGGVQKETKGKIANENILHISNLFGGSKDDEPILTDQELQSFGIGPSSQQPSVQSLRFNAESRTSDLNNLMKDFDLDAGTTNDNKDDDNKDEGQDLLDLMDMA